MSGLRSSNELSVVYGGVIRPVSIDCCAIIMFGGGGGGGGVCDDGGGSPTGQPSCVVWQNIWFFQRSVSILAAANMDPPVSRSQSTLPISGLSDCERGFTATLSLVALEMVDAPPPPVPFAWLTAESVRISPIPLLASPLAAASASRRHWRRRKTTTTTPAMQSNTTTALRIPRVGVNIELLGRGSAMQSKDNVTSLNYVTLSNKNLGPYDPATITSCDDGYINIYIYSGPTFSNVTRILMKMLTDDDSWMTRRSSEKSVGAFIHLKRTRRPS